MVTALSRRGIGFETRVLYHSQSRFCINIFMRYSDLFEDFKSDVKYNTVMQYIAEKAQDFFANNQHKVDSFIKRNRFQYKNVDTLHFDAKQLGIDDAFEDLRIVLAEKLVNHVAEFDTATMANGERRHIITMFVADASIEDPEEKFIAAMKTMTEPRSKTIMVHEMTHYFQAIRGIPMTPPRKPGREGYLNDPKEFDAFYHQMTQEYHTLLSAFDDDRQYAIELLKQHGFTRDFRLFFTQFVATMQNKDLGEFDMITKSLPRQKKRLISRLYSLHQEILKKINS